MSSVSPALLTLELSSQPVALKFTSVFRMRYDEMLDGLHAPGHISTGVIAARCFALLLRSTCLPFRTAYLRVPIVQRMLFGVGNW